VVHKACTLLGVIFLVDKKRAFFLVANLPQHLIVKEENAIVEHKESNGCLSRAHQM
jgi:hypothetical protein